MLGLPAEDADTTAVDLAICHPTGDLDGSVEFVALPNTPGSHAETLASPGCRGLNLLRFPVTGVEAMAKELQDMSIEHTGLATWNLPPLGKVRGLALRTPDGSWLEFFEHL
jgi:hypothetical protein